MIDQVCASRELGSEELEMTISAVVVRCLLSASAPAASANPTSVTAPNGLTL